MQQQRTNPGLLETSLPIPKRCRVPGGYTNVHASASPHPHMTHRRRRKQNLVLSVSISSLSLTDELKLSIKEANVFNPTVLLTQGYFFFYLLLTLYLNCAVNFLMTHVQNS